MLKAIKMIWYKEKILAKHWTTREIVAFIIGIGIAIGGFVLLVGAMAPLDQERQKLLLYWALGGLTIGIALFATITSIQPWFSSPDAFYLMTKPYRVQDMYWFQFFDAAIRFVRAFWNIIVPVLGALGWVVNGVIGIITIFALFIITLILGVSIGFLIMFFMLKNKEKILVLITFAVILIGFILGSTILFRVHPLIFYGALPIEILIVCWLAQQYSCKEYLVCRDSVNQGFVIWLNPLAEKMLKSTVLFNRFLHPAFRATLYKELSLDARNVIFSLKYVAVIIFVAGFWPLSDLEFFKVGGTIAALIYCYLVLVLNIHESFITTFAKEGDKITYWLSKAYTWRIGLAKFAASVIEIVPLILIATIIIGSKLSFSCFQSLTFGVTLLVMSMIHVVCIVLLGTRYMNFENHDFTLMTGMIYDQVWGNVNPRILMGYIMTFMIPFALIGILWCIMEKGLAVHSLWWINIIGVVFINLCLFIGKPFYKHNLAIMLDIKGRQAR